MTRRAVTAYSGLLGSLAVRTNIAAASFSSCVQGGTEELTERGNMLRHLICLFSQPKQNALISILLRYALLRQRRPARANQTGA
jgi:hypothetical protein